MLEIDKIQKMLELDLPEIVIEQISENILSDFWHFKIADFTLIRKRLSYVKQYGQAKIGNIMDEIAQYNIERMNVAESLSEAQIKHNDKERERINKQIMDTYKLLKTKQPEKKTIDPVKRNKLQIKEIELLSKNKSTCLNCRDFESCDNEFKGSGYVCNLHITKI